MNCYNHPDFKAVASCINGCGRGLCKDCSEYYEVPICDHCREDHNREVEDDYTVARGGLLIRIAVNVVILICYIIFIFKTQVVNDSSSSSLGIVIIPLLIWGFFGVRWLVDAFQEVTGLIVFTSLTNWGCMYLVASIVLAGIAGLVIPVLIILQLIQLKRISNQL